MEPFDALLNVTETLLGSKGCLWSQKQTFQSLQPYVLEEAHEVIEAVDLDDDRKIVEELGDLLYTIVFYGKLAEKTERFSIQQIITAITEKLIRRHPHVFGDVHVDNMDQIVSNWETIKRREKGEKTTKIDEMPPTLPGLVRGQKILKRLKESGFVLSLTQEMPQLSEEELGTKLLELLDQANANDIDAENALRKSLNRLMDCYQMRKSS